jgi:hypothetical protein
MSQLRFWKETEQLRQSPLWSVAEDGRFNHAAGLGFDAEGNVLAVDADELEAETRF